MSQTIPEPITPGMSFANKRPQLDPTHIAVDGPDYAPNRKRRVIIIRSADMPGFLRCLDVETWETLTVGRGKLQLLPVPTPGVP